MQNNWHLINADNQILGRIATQTASFLIGKHKTSYAPNKNIGDFVVIINAEKIKLTRNKAQKKVYYYHTSYPGALKTVKYQARFEKKPEWVIYQAVKGMLPKNRLANERLKKLKIFRDEKHPYADKLA